MGLRRLRHRLVLRSSSPSPYLSRLCGERTDIRENLQQLHGIAARGGQFVEDDYLFRGVVWAAHGPSPSPNQVEGLGVCGKGQQTIGRITTDRWNSDFQLS